MATTKQKRVARLQIDNLTLDEPLTDGELVESGGYGPSMKKNPYKVLDSAGVKEALNEYGFSEDNAKRVVVEIMLDPEKDSSSRLKATDQVFKVHGSYASDKNPPAPPQLNVTLNLGDADKIRKEFEQKLKDSYIA